MEVNENGDGRREPPVHGAKRMSQELNLEPCPFCGGDAKYHNGYPPYDECHFIDCAQCDVSTPILSTKDAAIAAWNKRAQPAEAERCQCCGYLVTDREHFGCLRAAATPAAANQAGIPEGWKLVPETPTDEMLATLLSDGEYGVLAQHSMDPIGASAVLRLSGVGTRYANMLAAAPHTESHALGGDGE